MSVLAKFSHLYSFGFSRELFRHTDPSKFKMRIPKWKISKKYILICDVTIIHHTHIEVFPSDIIMNYVMHIKVFLYDIMNCSLVRVEVFLSYDTNGSYLYIEVF